MNKEIIYQIREREDLYTYLKFNSYYYKKILRNEITIKDLEKNMKQDLKQTPIDKLSDIRNKIELANTFINILSSN